MRKLEFLRLLVIALMTGSVLSAAEPVKARFTDLSANSGLKIAANTGVGGTNPHGVAVGDFDGNGLLDVIILTFGKPHIYYFHNLGNLKFKDETAASGLMGFEGEGTGIAVADYDNDGRPDLYVTSLRKGASRLFRNEGKGKFVDVSNKAGVLLTTPSRSCAWSDMDGDGFVDLYVTCPDGANSLFHNQRDGTFREIAQIAGVGLAGRHCLGCAFADANGDGLDDLFVTNYRSQESVLFRNLGGMRFEDVTAQAGLKRKASSVGCAFADIFNRGRLDLYVSTDSWLAGANYTEDELLKMKHTVEPNLLYVNDGKGKFTAFPEPLFNLKTLSHDVILEDLDHDGWLDIYVGVDAESGNKWATSKGGNPLWTRADGKTWKEVSKEWGVRHVANCVCVPAADFDNDGDLDLLLINFYSQPVLYRNETNDMNWLRVKPQGKKTGRDGIGAKVSVIDSDGKMVGFRQVQSGAGYCRCSPLEAHFGLGKKLSPGYRIEVVFPGSKKPVAVEKVKPGQYLVVKED